MKVLVTAPINRFPKVIKEFESFSDLTIKEYLDKKKLKKIISQFDGLVPNARIPIDKNIIETATNLKAIYQPSLGYEHIDTITLKKKRILFGCLAFDKKFKKSLWSTAEHTLTLILSLIKKFHQANYRVTNFGEWDNRKYHIQDLQGKIIGIIGLGNIGSKVAKLSSYFGANILVHDPYINSKKYKLVSLNELCSKSDIITLHVPYSKDTKNLISKKQLIKMKNNVCLVNTSRGGIVNEKDLKNFIKNNKNFMYGADVLEEESPFGVKNNSLVKLSKIYKNIFITPHIGGSSFQYMEKIFMHSAVKLRNFLLL
jgi:D-3-phosphoglycerate dehydrogenase / 2-oxoglutarate reductase